MNSNIVNFSGQKISSKFAHIDPNKGLGGGVQGGFPILNYRAKNWSLKYQGNIYKFTREDDGSALTYLDVIIVGDSEYISKMYFAPGDWTEDSVDAPICTSIRGDVPDPGVSAPQSKTCVSCRHYSWTTLPNGRQGKPCQDHKRLAVLLMPAVTRKMLGSPLLEPVYLKVPPASLIPLKAYGDMLRHEGFPFSAVVTRISFSQDKMFQMIFTGQQVLSDKEADTVIPLLDDPRTQRITGEAPVIREVTPIRSAIPQEAVRVDTGLEEAFGDAIEVEPERKPGFQTPFTLQNKLEEAGAPPYDKEEIIPPPTPPKRRGRPPKTGPMVDMGEEVAQAEAASSPPAAPRYDELDDDLDGDVANLLNTKTENFLT